ncbi:hypothetical protein A3F08_02760 [Candidatus Berkelbacteria bacterium RIFCSPHIGHO2_12_FULL_36_9]|uniref:SMP-30/Gluconolactonase/LRE-like region domain-containing protein n=1 Tax=Candidatus Berkelbacteria bacterium RIFCSPHIGHO2_12_FULL_36_9 TaxID=1797469 RepID=A0A1F5EED8_9BACT|nr:MAG: hypothetical protein A3F08_02760 [Candidatus Berkelbacteria bacterium RIFCSPHIGHO2_12_FULL_36_9]
MKRRQTILFGFVCFLLVILVGCGSGGSTGIGRINPDQDQNGNQLHFQAGWTANIPSSPSNISSFNDQIYVTSPYTYTVYSYYTVNGNRAEFNVFQPYDPNWGFTSGAGFDNLGTLFVTSYNGYEWQNPPGNTLGVVETTGYIIDVDGTNCENSAYFLQNPTGFGSIAILKGNFSTYSTLVSDIDVTYMPNSIGIHSDTNRAFVSCSNNYGIRVYDLTNNVYVDSYMTDEAFVSGISIRGNWFFANCAPYYPIYDVSAGNFDKIGEIYVPEFTGQGGVEIDELGDVYITDSTRNEIKQFILQKN